MGSLRLNGEKDADYYAPVAFASYCLPPLVTKKCFTFGYKGMLWFMLGWLKQKTNSLNNQDGYEISAYDKEFENSILNWLCAIIGELVLLVYAKGVSLIFFGSVTWEELIFGVVVGFRFFCLFF